MSDTGPTTDEVKADVDPYLWLVCVAVFMGFVYAFGIGANDVANSFASTVASGSLTLKQAIIVAGIFEFLGSLLLGASVTQTIRGKIFDPELYADEPQIMLLGLTTSIITASGMLLVATHFAFCSTGINNAHHSRMYHGIFNHGEGF
jgi:phosphate/sulfate permease